MRDPRHPRHFTDDFKRQIVDLYNAGKPKREIMDEYDLGKSTVERWIKSINATGSPRAADNRTPEQNRILELERENRRLRMEVDVLKQAALIYARKLRAIAANEGRYPISAQCRLLGVARSTYYSMRSRADRPDAPDPAAPAVVAAHAASKGRYGSRKIKASLERSGVTVSRRRVCRIMRENGLVSAYGRKRFKVHPGAVNEADVPNVVARGFGGRAPRTHICSDLTYVRVGASWNYVCLLVDLYNREIVGHSAGPRKDARLVKSAFATLSFPISDIEVFHTDRGSEFDNAEIDLMLEAFGIERSLSAKGCPYDNAVDESTNRILKAELVHRETFGTTRELRAKLSDYVHWYNNFRIHSTLGYMSPVEFREAGLSLPESSK
ncbi:MAG TPA: IS3 family transposase [Coriobacteriaceae bacterium]|nr:IS3 family transposase [Coriobacteriaceae bacterium]HJI41326.1 IS3 family transposase [Coriobacteriaceae bacterium]HJI41347.1 IS3 family transposase [Coriobacteriaceae bacterium]